MSSRATLLSPRRCGRTALYESLRVNHRVRCELRDENTSQVKRRRSDLLLWQVRGGRAGPYYALCYACATATGCDLIWHTVRCSLSLWSVTYISLKGSNLAGRAPQSPHLKNWEARGLSSGTAAAGANGPRLAWAPGSWMDMVRCARCGGDAVHRGRRRERGRETKNTKKEWRWASE